LPNCIPLYGKEGGGEIIGINYLFSKSPFLPLFQRGNIPHGGVIMAVIEKKVVWETDMKKALSRAKAEKKYVMLDFFNPG